MRSSVAAAARVQQPLASANSAAASAAARGTVGRRRHSTHCQAAGTQQGRERQTSGYRSNRSSSSSAGSSSWANASASSDPLLRSIVQSSTARELHQLLWRHSAELGAREVAAALEVTAKRKLLQASTAATKGGAAGSASGSSSAGSSGALAPLLVQLADKFAPVMPPPCLSAAAWSLAALQLAPARPVMQRMHTLAERQLPLFAPSQLCALLWAGGTLDPATHSPLFLALAGFVQRGMSLALFSSHDLAALMWICGREGGTAARDISIAVADECRARLQALRDAEERAASPIRGRPRAATASSASSSDRLLGSPSPAPAFAPAEAAMLLTGLAQQQLRVGGLVEPLLRQCEAQLGEAEADDVARIIIALGELLMETGPEPMSALLVRLCEVEAQLSPQQVASALWACVRLGSKYAKHVGRKTGSMAIRHFTQNQAAYRSVDTIGLLWGIAHMQRAMPDEALMVALQAVQPELQQCSNAGLSNLLWALGKTAEIRTKTKPSWLSQPAGAAVLGAAESAFAELARRAPGMQPADLAAVAASLAVHPPLAAALPARDLAVLRDACMAAAASDSFLSFDVAQVSTAAARLRWTERPLVDALAFAIQQRVNLALTTSEVFSQSVWALASLAPSRYSELFASLASTYAAKMQHPERLPAHVAGFQAEERSAVLSAFASVARCEGLPRSIILELLASVSAIDLRHIPLTDAVPLLLLAAEARVGPEQPAVQASFKTVKRSFPRLSLEALRHVHSSLSRMLPSTDPTLLAIERHIFKSEQDEHVAAQPRRRKAQAV